MIKKYLLFLVLALPAFGQVSTQKVVNTAVIYETNSPVTFNGGVTVNGSQTNNGSLHVTNNISAGGNLTVLGTDSRLPNQTLATSSNILTRGLADARYRQAWSWYLSAGGGHDNAQGNYSRQNLVFSDLNGFNSVVTQQDGIDGTHSFYTLPIVAAGKSVIIKTTFATKVAETNAVNSSVVWRHVLSYVTNLATMTERVTSSGDDPQGSSSQLQTVAIIDTQRYYQATTTNTVPSTALSIMLESFRVGGNGADTMTTNAYAVTLDAEILN